MMIDFALEAERKEGKSPEDAIYQACLLRFRPIMMTTMAALLGGLPLALGTGIGSELRRPLGIAMVGGLILSQVLTLYTTPVIYIFFDRLAHEVSRQARCQDTKTASAPAEQTHEHFLSIHSPAGRHHALDGGHRARRRGGFQLLPVSPLPQVDFPTISVGAVCRERVRKSWLRRWPRRSSASSAGSPASRK